jgi:hypothetical protein
MPGRSAAWCCGGGASPCCGGTGRAP